MAHRAAEGQGGADAHPGICGPSLVGVCPPRKQGPPFPNSHKCGRAVTLRVELSFYPAESEGPWETMQMWEGGVVHGSQGTGHAE